ncbi:hypothetical protein V8G57_15740 [Collimonas sp. H4R21]|uniref:Uncharacterized protein n=1 Tax=Collimonas rhizosphaerae TaxID=3126357 RepID=A0ABU9PXX4_9BURK
MKPWLTWALAGVLVAGSFASGWTVNGWRQELVVSRLETDAATVKATLATEARADLARYIDTLQLSSANYLAAQKYQTGQINTIIKDLKHVKDSAPLGADCRPGDARGLLLQRAIDTVNATAAP